MHGRKVSMRAKWESSHRGLCNDITRVTRRLAIGTALSKASWQVKDVMYRMLVEDVDENLMGLLGLDHQKVAE